MNDDVLVDVPGGQQALIDFPRALDHLKSNWSTQGIRRHGWNGKNMTVRLQKPDENSKMTAPYLYIEYPGDEPPMKRLPWVASQADILAEDWLLVATEEPPTL